MDADSERQALLTLVRAADGRATREPVTILALALLSPWSGDRSGYRNRPNRPAAADSRRVLEFLDEVGPLPAGPTDRGLVAWMAHHNLAAPVASLPRISSWLTHPELADAWIALPPAAGYPQAPVDDRCIAADGRIAALHLLVTQVMNTQAPTAPTAAITTVAEWFVGQYAVTWSRAAGDQCRRMRSHTAGYFAWTRTVAATPAERVQAHISRAVPLVPESWRPPAPTSDELTAAIERRRILAEGAVAYEAWKRRRTPVDVG